MSEPQQAQSADHARTFEPNPRAEAHREPGPAYVDLAGAVRDLVDACVRTETDPGTATAVATEVRRLTERLRSEQLDLPRNLTAVRDGALDDSGNPAVGARNPIAPPLDVAIDPADPERVTCDFRLGAAYEGPPGCVHGGYVAVVLDQLMGTVPWLSGRPGMTAYLNVSYRSPTRLGTALRAEAWLERRDGWKTFVHGRVTAPDGTVTAEAEGLFVTPRAARGAGAVPETDGARPRGG